MLLNIAAKDFPSFDFEMSLCSFSLAKRLYNLKKTFIP